MKEREEQLRKEEEQRELERKQKEETEQVRKEVSEYRKSIEQIQKNIKRSNENLRNWFKLFDENNDDFMEFEEFKRLLKQINVVVKDSDLGRLFELMDLQQSGKISYNDFCDVIEKNRTLPIEKIVKKRREERGETFIEGLDEDIKLDDLKIRTALGETGGSNRKDISTVDGMSAILHRSNIDYGDK